MTAHRQIVAPASAKHETLYLSLALCLVIGLSAIIIAFNQKSNANAQTLSSHETSVRYHLSAAEQSIYADLQLLYQHWRISPEHLPSVEEWIEEDWPPFTDELYQLKRGSHVWSQLADAQTNAYLGISQNTDLSGHFLWICDDSSKEAPDVWLSHHTLQAPPNALTEEALIATGWQKINPSAHIVH